MHIKRATFSVLLATSLLSACAQNVQPEQDQKPAVAKSEEQLPKVELTGELLYDIMLGEVAGRRGQFEVSVLALTRAANRSHDPRLAERATKAALYAKKYSLGLKAAKIWVRYAPNSVDAKLSLATLYLYLNKPVKAQLHFEEVIKLAAERGQLSEAYMEITGMMSRQRNRDAALEVMQTLVDLHPKNPEGQYAVAHLALRSGKSDTAVKAIDEALRLRPHWDDAALLKGQILIAAKGGDRTEEFYRDYLRSNSKSYRVRLSYARYLVDLKRWEKARDQFARVVEQRPEDRETLYALGLLSLQTGHLEDADAHFRRVVELDPEHDQARLYLGQVAEKRKRYDEAQAWYAGVTSPANRFDAQVRLGIVLAHQGKLKEAREHLANIKPHGDEEIIQLALAEEQILREAKQYKEALKVLTRALKELPFDKDLLYARALIAEKLDDMALHEADLRKILKADPKNAHALNALGYSLADRTSRLDEALSLIKRALEVRPNDPFILDSMGWVHYRMGNHDEAIEYLKKALDIRADPEISAHLGEVMWVSGDREGAEKVWRRALKTTPDSEPLLDIIKKFKP